MSIFTFTPSYSSDLTEDPKVRGTQLGDGYTQVMSDGLNPILRRYRLVFSSLTDATLAEIRTFMRLRAGADPFDWTPPAPDATKGRWLNTGPKTSMAGFDYSSLVLEFQEQPRASLATVAGSLDTGTVARGNPVVATLTVKDASGIVVEDWQCDASELVLTDDTGLVWTQASVSWSFGVATVTVTCPGGTTVGARTLLLTINGVSLAVTPSGLPVTVS